MRRIPWPGILCTLVIGCTSGAGGTTGGPGSASPLNQGGYRVSLVSTNNRHNLAGGFEGGWGPHLRSFLRDPNDSLWFVIDVGETVEQNIALDYYRARSSGGEWTRAASQPQIAGVQQNVATILAGGTIYSYGVDVLGHRLEECTLDTMSAQPGGCAAVLQSPGQPLVVPPDSNYVGAAITPAGDRLVWWTTVSTSSGSWSYTVGNDSGWTAPVVSNLVSFGFLGYVHVAFENENDLVLGGQVITGAYGPSAQLASVLGRLHLGDPLGPLSVVRAAGGSPIYETGDVWVNRSSGTLHYAGDGPRPGLPFQQNGTPEGYAGYEVSTLSLQLAAWTPGTDLSAARTFPASFRARFREDVDHTLHLLVGRAVPGEPWKVRGSLRDFSVPAGASRSAIDWQQSRSRVVPTPAGCTWIDGIWVESTPYQTTPVKGASFGFTGVVGVSDDHVWHVQGMAPEFPVKR